jgi:uncharacterized membrane protein YfcA
LAWWLILLLAPLFALVACAYAAVGLGGGTGYLALMTLIGVEHSAMPSTALALNLLVTSVALLRYGLAGRIPWKVFIPFLLPAIPCAFAGGLIDAPKELFHAVLAVGLTAAGVMMLRSARSASDECPMPPATMLWLTGVPVGAVIGIASGFLGIGGGVFLGPVLLLLRWAGPKQVAAVSSMLILILSAVALAAHGARGAIEIDLMLPLAAAVLVGGAAGAHIGEAHLPATRLQQVFAVIVIIAGIFSGIKAAGS